MLEAQDAGAGGEILQWLVAHADQLGGPTNEADFELLCMNALRKLIGHRVMFAAVGRLSSTDYRVLRAWNFGCPAELVATMTRGGPMSSQPTLVQWLGLKQPLVLAADTSDSSDVGLTLARHGLSSRALHGVIDGAGAVGSVFVFFGLQAGERAALHHALRLVVPHLHAALMHLCREQSLQTLAVLTKRERQLVRLVSDGKTNPQIAREWCRSVSTVRNLLHRLMGKLNVSSRAQLATIGSQMNLLEDGRSPVQLKAA